MVSSSSSALSRRGPSLLRPEEILHLLDRADLYEDDGVASPDRKFYRHGAKSATTTTSTKTVSKKDFFDGTRTTSSAARESDSSTASTALDSSDSVYGAPSGSSLDEEISKVGPQEVLASVEGDGKPKRKPPSPSPRPVGHEEHLRVTADHSSNNDESSDSASDSAPSPDSDGEVIHDLTRRIGAKKLRRRFRRNPLLLKSDLVQNPIRADLQPVPGVLRHNVLSKAEQGVRKSYTLIKKRKRELEKDDAERERREEIAGELEELVGDGEGDERLLEEVGEERDEEEFGEKLGRLQREAAAIDIARREKTMKAEEEAEEFEFQRQLGYLEHEMRFRDGEINKPPAHNFPNSGSSGVEITGSYSSLKKTKTARQLRIEAREEKARNLLAGQSDAVRFIGGAGGGETDLHQNDSRLEKPNFLLSLKSNVSEGATTTSGPAGRLGNGLGRGNGGRVNPYAAASERFHVVPGEITADLRGTTTEFYNNGGKPEAELRAGGRTSTTISAPPTRTFAPKVFGSRHIDHFDAAAAPSSAGGTAGGSRRGTTFLTQEQHDEPAATRRTSSTTSVSNPKMTVDPAIFRQLSKTGSDADLRYVTVRKDTSKGPRPIDMERLFNSTTSSSEVYFPGGGGAGAGGGGARTSSTSSSSASATATPSGTSASMKYNFRFSSLTTGFNNHSHLPDQHFQTNTNLIKLPPLPQNLPQENAGGGALS